MESYTSPRRRTALLAVADGGLRNEVRRVAAAIDCRLEEVDAPIPRAAWMRSHVIVLDAAAAREMAADGATRRAGLVVVTSGTADLEDWQCAALVGATGVTALPADESELAEILGARREPERGGGVVIAVVGGRGGGGASTMAAALATTAAETRFRERTLLVDGDGFGGGIDLLLGIEDVPGLRWPSLTLEGGRIAAGALHAALPSARAGLAVLACGRRELHLPTPAAVTAVLESGRGAGDAVIGDVPRRDGGIAEAFLEAADLTLLVVPAELRASAGAEALARYVTARCGNTGLIVRGPSPGGLRGSEIADVLGVPLVAAIRPEPGLTDRLERGGLRLGRRSPLRQAALAALTAVPVGMERVA